MTQPDLETLLSWRGRTVLDRDGQKLGKLGALYLDGAGDQPAYAGIHTGLFGRHESIVPLDGIDERDEELWVPHDAHTVKASPNVDPDATLSGEDEVLLRAHYDAAPQGDVPRPEGGIDSDGRDGEGDLGGAGGAGRIA